MEQQHGLGRQRIGVFKAQHTHDSCQRCNRQSYRNDIKSQGERGQQAQEYKELAKCHPSRIHKGKTCNPNRDRTTTGHAPKLPKPSKTADDRGWPPHNRVKGTRKGGEDPQPTIKEVTPQQTAMGKAVEVKRIEIRLPGVENTKYPKSVGSMKAETPMQSPTMICCGWDVSLDDTSKTVYVRNSRNPLQTKIFIYSRYDVICTLCPW